MVQNLAFFRRKEVAPGRKLISDILRPLPNQHQKMQFSPFWVSNCQSPRSALGRPFGPDRGGGRRSLRNKKSFPSLEDHLAACAPYSSHDAFRLCVSVFGPSAHHQRVINHFEPWLVSKHQQAASRSIHPIPCGCQPRQPSVAAQSVGVGDH